MLRKDDDNNFVLELAVISEGRTVSGSGRESLVSCLELNLGNLDESQNPSQQTTRGKRLEAKWSWHFTSFESKNVSRRQKL